MEILILVLLYYLSQNSCFAESIKPIMEQLKDSEHMLSFLNDLSHFAQTFGSYPNPPPPPKKEACQTEKAHDKPPENKKEPQSPTAGIADAFIQQILDNYLQNNR